MMNKKWMALLCCVTLAISPMSQIKTSQGAAKTQKQTKDKTKTSGKKTNWNTIFCPDCKAKINAYLQKWCMP